MIRVTVKVMPMSEQPEILFKIRPELHDLPMQQTLDEICKQCGLQQGCYRLILDGAIVVSTKDLCQNDKLLLVPENNPEIIRLAQMCPVDSLNQVVQESLQHLQMFQNSSG
jgi:hypothetical protein